MLKRLLLASLISVGFIAVTYPSKIEKTKLFDYCYSFEKLISRNLVQKSGNLSGSLKSISKDIAKYGVSKTEGTLINKIIAEYKTSKDSFIINFLPNEVYCLGGYWIEKINPGKFESLLFEKSQKTIKDLKELKEEVDLLIRDFNSDYKTLIEEIYDAF